MKFGDYVLASLIGTVAGFIFSIFLFYLTEKWKRHQAKGTIIKGLKNEYEFNLSLLRQWLNVIETILRQNSSNVNNLTEHYGKLKYSSYQRYFLNHYFSAGHLYDVLTSDDLVYLDAVLTHFSGFQEDFLNNIIAGKGPGESSTLAKRQSYVSRIFETERAALDSFIKRLPPIYIKIE